MIEWYILINKSQELFPTVNSIMLGKWKQEGQRLFVSSCITFSIARFHGTAATIEFPYWKLRVCAICMALFNPRLPYWARRWGSNGKDSCFWSHTYGFDRQMVTVAMWDFTEIVFHVPEVMWATALWQWRKISKRFAHLVQRKTCNLLWVTSFTLYNSRPFFLAAINTN